MANDPNDAEGGARAQVEDVDTLRARVRELEAELARKNRQVSESRRERSDAGDSVREVSDRANDQARRLLRGIVHSQLEGLRLTGQLVSSFAEDVARRNPPEDTRTERDLPRDVMDGIIDAIDRSIDIPEKTIDAFYDSYDRARKANR